MYSNICKLYPDELEREVNTDRILKFDQGEYKGDLEGTEPHGHGVFIFNPSPDHNLQKYEGYFSRGEFDGQGQL